MITRIEVKEKLIKALETYLDSYLNEALFYRKNNSLIYSRKNKEVSQEIDIQFIFKPKYQHGVYAHIYPMIRVMIPKISDVATDMVGGNILMLANAPDIILNQPMDLTMPKTNHIRWFASEYSEFVDVVVQIKGFIEKWALDFLNEYNSIKSIINGYELNDSRLMRQQHWYIYVASAYVLQNNWTDAKNVVEERFGLPGLRKHFSELFNYFSRFKNDE